MILVGRPRWTLVRAGDQPHHQNGGEVATDDGRITRWRLQMVQEDGPGEAGQVSPRRRSAGGAGKSRRPATSRACPGRPGTAAANASSAPCFGSGRSTRPWNGRYPTAPRPSQGRSCRSLRTYETPVRPTKTSTPDQPAHTTPPRPTLMSVLQGAPRRRGAGKLCVGDGVEGGCRESG